MVTKEKLIRTSHASLAYCDSGRDRLPIVLLHTQSASKDVFHHQFESALADEFRLLSIDLPGHGASSDAYCPEHTYSLPGYADSVIEVLEMLGIERAAVVGWGVGGQIGLEMTASFPAITGVMLTGAAPIGTDGEALLSGFWPHSDFALASQLSLDEGEVVRLSAMMTGERRDPRLEAAVRRADGRSRAMLMGNLRRGAFTDGRHLVQTSDVSVAVVNGECDPVFDGGYTRGLRFNNLWEGQCRTIPNIGHMPFAEMPDIFNQILKRFLRDLESGSEAVLGDAGLTLSA